jgi:hypothetical protein
MEESCVFIIDAGRGLQGMRTFQWSMILRCGWPGSGSDLKDSFIRGSVLRE